MDDQHCQSRAATFDGRLAAALPMVLTAADADARAHLSTRDE